MKATTRAEIKRLIGNRHSEAHPFKRGSAGMEGFARMLPLVDQLTTDEVRDFLLPMVDELLNKVSDCFACQAKLLVFAEMFCSRRVPLQAIEYWKKYRALMSCLEEIHYTRDFRSEVYEVIERYCGQAVKRNNC